MTLLVRNSDVPVSKPRNLSVPAFANAGNPLTFVEITRFSKFIWKSDASAPTRPRRNWPLIPPSTLRAVSGFKLCSPPSLQRTPFHRAVRPGEVAAVLDAHVKHARRRHANRHRSVKRSRIVEIGAAGVTFPVQIVASQ